MADDHEVQNLPAQVAAAVAGIPKALVPASLKALDRLVGATVDIPVAWLAQKKAKIDAQTQAFTLVEAAIAKSAASEVGADETTVRNAVEVLVRKSYRKQVNREAVAAAMVEDLRAASASSSADNTAPPSLDEDWLNVFERYAEDASSERLQNLWGSVLAGEIRKPGRYSARTLRFLSEFSQADALLFADFCQSVFGDMCPNSLVKPDGRPDIRHLLSLEAAGLIQGSDGGFENKRKLDGNGNSFIVEGELAIWLQGEPGAELFVSVCALTPLGQELLSLLPGRDAKAAAKAVANAIRSPVIESAFLGSVKDGRINRSEVLWQKGS